MLLRGTTVDMVPQIFSIEDIPVKINNECTALINKQNSPLIVTKSIVRGVDDGSYFETDMVLDKSLNYLGTIVYRKGFKLYNPETKEFSDVPDTKDVIIESELRFGNVTDDVNLIIEPVEWFQGDYKVGIKDIVTGVGNKLVTTYSGTRLIPIKLFKLFTGIYIGDKPVCFGDTIKGGTVILHNGIPVIKNLKNEYIKIEEGE